MVNACAACFVRHCQHRHHIVFVEPGKLVGDDVLLFRIVEMRGVIEMKQHER